MESNTCIQLSWKSFVKDIDQIDFSTLFTLNIPFNIDFKFYKGYPILRIILLNNQKFYHIFRKNTHYKNFFQYIFQTMSIDDNEVITLNKTYLNHEYQQELFSSRKYLKVDLFTTQKLMENNLSIQTSFYNQKKEPQQSNLSPSIIKYLFTLFIGHSLSGFIHIAIYPHKNIHTNDINLKQYKLHISAEFFDSYNKEQKVNTESKANPFHENEVDKDSFNVATQAFIDHIKDAKYLYTLSSQKPFFNLNRIFSRTMRFFKREASLSGWYILNNLLKISSNDFPLLSDFILKKFEDNKQLFFNNTSIQKNNDYIEAGYRILDGMLPFPPLEITLEDLSSHLSCFGITSSGKSRFTYHLIHELTKKDIKFLVFDVKGEYFPALSNLNQNFLYYKPGSESFNLQLNIFHIPEDIQTDDYTNFLFSLFLQIIGDNITPQQSMLLHQSISRVIKTRGNFHDFIKLVEDPRPLNMKGAKIEFSTAGLLNRILPLTTGVAGRCFNVNNSNIDFQTLVNNNLIIDISAFEHIENNLIQKVFVNVLYYYYFYYIRETRGKIRNPGDINNVVIVEEAEKLLASKYDGKTEIHSIIGTSTWTARAYGCCMIFVGTDPVVETSILSNTGISIIFFSKSEPVQMAKLLNLPLNEYQKLLPLLRLRQYFIISNKGKIQLCRSKDFPLPSHESVTNRYFFLTIKKLAEEEKRSL